MDKEIIQHIFEPFFSTKVQGESTGLGLSVVYGIIKQHEGWINVYSKPELGAAFRIYFPAVLTEPDVMDEQWVSLAEFQGRGERILLVEDDVAIRELNARILQGNGYVPFSAASAEEALERHLAQTKKLQATIEKLNRAITLEDAYSSAIEGVITVLNADRASILLFDPDGVIRFKAWEGLSPDYRSVIEGYFPWDKHDLKAQQISCLILLRRIFQMTYKLPLFVKEFMPVHSFL
jgi:CheY-like chemotaxis protein